MIWLKLVTLIWLLLLCAAVCSADLLRKQSGSQVLSLQGDISPVHDPTIIRQGTTYYVFATNRFNQKLIPIFCSQDLQQWKFCGNVFEKVPEWAMQEIPGTRGIWAPDISYVDGEYRLYYAVSTFGSNRSVIGLITNKTLDSKSPDYKWIDKGLVVGSTKEDDFNAIDPAQVEDLQGNSWLAFGSFWSGIKLRKLDRATGKLADDDTKFHAIASRRPLDPPAIEGPAIIRHDGYYYLFVSFDFCCRGKDSTYKIVVGRAKEITGPYVDQRGKPMMMGGGTALFQGSNNWSGAGGQSVLNDSSGDILAFHSYSKVTGKATLMISRLSWKNGWPEPGALP
jgi:arabinan endo-1,5-alpha-L-arabinosidase